MQSIYIHLLYKSYILILLPYFFVVLSVIYHAVKVRVPSFLDDTTMQNAQIAMIERSESVGIVITTNHSFKLTKLLFFVFMTLQFKHKPDSVVITTI